MVDNPADNAVTQPVPKSYLGVTSVEKLFDAYRPGLVGGQLKVFLHDPFEQRKSSAELLKSLQMNADVLLDTLFRQVNRLLAANDQTPHHDGKGPFSENNNLGAVRVSQWGHALDDHDRHQIEQWVRRISAKKALTQTKRLPQAKPCDEAGLRELKSAVEETLGPIFFYLAFNDRDAGDPGRAFESFLASYESILHHDNQPPS